MYEDLIGRHPGILVEVSVTSLWVDCLDAPADLPPGTGATLELIAQGRAFWCHTSLEPGLPCLPERLHLTWPQTVQLTQQRQHNRVETQVPIHYLRDGDRSPDLGLIINLSEGGAALQSPTPLSPGQTIALFFAPGSGLYLQEVRANVLRCNQTKEGNWVSGLRFQDLTFPQIQRISGWLLGQVGHLPESHQWG